MKIPCLTWFFFHIVVEIKHLIGCLFLRAREYFATIRAPSDWIGRTGNQVIYVVDRRKRVVFEICPRPRRILLVVSTVATIIAVAIVEMNVRARIVAGLTVALDKSMVFGLIDRSVLQIKRRTAIQANSPITVCHGSLVGVSVDTLPDAFIRHFFEIIKVLIRTAGITYEAANPAGVGLRIDIVPAYVVAHFAHADIIVGMANCIFLRIRIPSAGFHSADNALGVIIGRAGYPVFIIIDRLILGAFGIRPRRVFVNLRMCAFVSADRTHAVYEFRLAVACRIIARIIGVFRIIDYPTFEAIAEEQGARAPQ